MIDGKTINCKFYHGPTLGTSVGASVVGSWVGKSDNVVGTTDAGRVVGLVDGPTEGSMERLGTSLGVSLKEVGRLDVGAVGRSVSGLLGTVDVGNSVF